MAETKSKQKISVDIAPIHAQIAVGKTARRVLKKPETSEASRDMKAEILSETNRDVKATTKSKVKCSVRKRQAVNDTQKPENVPLVTIKREREIEPTREFEQTTTRPTNSYKKQKTNEEAGPMSKPQQSASTASSRPRCTISKTANLTASSSAVQQWKQETISHYDSTQTGSHRYGQDFRNTVAVSKGLGAANHGRPELPTSSDHRRIPGPIEQTRRKKTQVHEASDSLQTSSMSTERFVKQNIKTKKAPNEDIQHQDDHYSGSFCKPFQAYEFNHAPISPSESSASADMDIQSLSFSQSSSKSSTPPTSLAGHHVIAASPQQKRQPLHTQRQKLSKSTTRSPLEMQQELLGKLTGLADAILEQQERNRHSQLQHVVQHNVEKFDKSIGEVSNALRIRLGFSAIEPTLEDAVTQHRLQVHTLKQHLNETLLSMQENEAEDDDLLSDCSKLKEIVMQNGQSLLQDRMKVLIKRMEGCRTKRRHQMQSKLKDIKDKFNSNDLLAMQALLGRI
ncbi:hypothetical protein, variant [Aphanomyces invadans]|uniref:Uncharacterized protein n=1 Tax=Aphanomyces invadans TaxID=157072 RepID=A0A024U7P9_9STRA|nr:hypothetical protein, variant [Aphanomyces invadans]ETW01887.1 hypothetical protein, variant [Aphanomyces invadans]|eukprot:XP_008869735.1 hypothetical protein, variant [Aphanomyces invadans]